MLNLAVRNTRKLIREKSKTENIRLGRLFTKKKTAAWMANMMEPTEKETVTLLDPGAGTGILSAAAIERICAMGGVKEICLTCYENDPVFLPMLENNLLRIRKKCRHDYGVKLVYSIHNDNFVLAMRDVNLHTLFAPELYTYDYIITNPPKELCRKDSAEASCMPEIFTGAMDLSFLFAALSTCVLHDGGQLIALLPSTVSTASYLAKYRRHMAESAAIERVHLFLNRAKDEKRTEGLRKNMIVKYVKGARTPEFVRISTCHGDEVGEDVRILPPLPYSFVVRKESNTLRLPKSRRELDILYFVNGLPATMSSLGLKLRNGLTLESRYPDMVRDVPEPGTVPLIHPRAIADGQVSLAKNTKSSYLFPTIPSLVQKNRNILLIKRIPAKSEGRHLVCAVYLASQFPRYKYISTHNKLLYIDYADDKKEMSAQFLHGLYAILSSTLYENYFSIVSASKQVSISDYAELPLPEERIITAIGANLMMTRTFSRKACDALTSSFLRVPEEVK